MGKKGRLALWGATAPGDKAENQDRFLIQGVIQPRSGVPGAAQREAWVRRGESLVTAVADGISGCADGGLAAQLTLEAACGLEAEDWFLDPQACLEQVNAAVARGFAAAYGPENPGGATLAAVAVTGGLWLALALGDSPVYRLQGEALVRLTQPHTVAAYRREQGLGEASPQEEHTLYAFVGGPRLTPGLVQPVLGRAAAGEGLLLCSDGVAEALTEAEIVHILNQKRAVQNPAQALVAAARRAPGGKRDNLTAVVLRFY